MTRNLIISLTLSLVLILAFAADIMFGNVDISPEQIWALFTGEGEAGSAVWNIVWQYRLPKALTALLCGAALSVSGLLMQTLFRNPLAGPYVLGISSGAGLGVAVIVLATQYVTLPAVFMSGGWGQTLAAIIGAAFVMFLVLFTSTKINDTVSLLIVGMMFGSIAGAAVNVLQSLSNPDALKIYVVWTMGSLSSVTWEYMAVMAPLILVSIFVTLLMPKRLNALLLGENYAKGLGVSVFATRFMIIVITCLLAGASTAFTGPIAFIGVAVPHIVRGLYKTSDHRVVVPASVLAGASLLLICDLISQLPGTVYTLPVNSVCALIGAPIILWVIIRNKHLQY